MSALKCGFSSLGINIITVVKDGCLLHLTHSQSLLVFSITYVPAEYLEEYKVSSEQEVFSETAPPPK